MGDISTLEQLQLAAASTAQLGMALQLPLLTCERFAELIGLSAPTVRSAVDRGYWPTIHVGRRVFINLEALRAMCANKVLS